MGADDGVHVRLGGQHGNGPGEPVQEGATDGGADVELRHAGGDRRRDGVGRKARPAVDGEWNVDALVHGLQPVEVDHRRSVLEQVDVPDGDGEAVDACRFDERGRLVGIGEAGGGVVDRAACRVGQVAELGLDGCSAGVRRGRELPDRGNGFRVAHLPGVHHHRVEPGVEPA